MKGVLVLLLASGIASAQLLETPPSENYTLSDVTRAFAQCRDSIELAAENLQQFPMPQLKGVPYDEKPQSGAAWLEACVLGKLQGIRVEFPLLG